MATSDYIEGKTSSGFEYKIARDSLDDWELLEKMSEMDGMAASVYITKALLDEEQYKALKEHCRNEAGRVPASRIDEEMKEILNQFNGQIEEVKLKKVKEKE